MVHDGRVRRCAIPTTSLAMILRKPLLWMMGFLLVASGIALAALSMLSLGDGLRLHASAVGFGICIAIGAGIFLVLGALFMVRAWTWMPEDFDEQCSGKSLRRELRLIEWIQNPEQASVFDRIQPRAWRHVCGFVSCVVGASSLFAVCFLLAAWLLGELDW